MNINAPSTKPAIPTLGDLIVALFEESDNDSTAVTEALYDLLCSGRVRVQRASENPAGVTV